MEDGKGQMDIPPLDILADIRNTESPGRRGGVSPYAQAIYRYYAEIQELLGEGFTLATICKYFERKDVLPQGADMHSFRRAYRRESVRRKKTAKPKEVRRKHVPEKHGVTMAVTETEAVSDGRSKADSREQRNHSVKASPGLQVKPDNTFEIRPVDPDDLPDIEKII